MGHRVAELEVVVNANVGQAQRELNNLNRTFHNIIAGGALLGAGGGLVGWFKDAVTSGAQFEQTMIRVQQLATGAEVSVDALTKKAFAVDQTTIYSAQQIAEAMEQLGREGFTGEQILGGWTDAAVNFAAVIDEDLTLATNIFGQVARVFKDEGLSAARTADILSQAILRSGRPAAEFATGMQYIGSIAAQLGVPLEETATSLSYLQSLGIKGRSAGTGLRSMFTELAAGADEFGMSHGVQAFDPVTGNFVGMPKIIDQFNELLSTMSKAEGLSFLEDIFGKPASSPLYALFTGGTEAYDEHLRKMEDLGTAAAFMRTLMDTIGGSLDRFEAAASNAMRQIGVIGGNMIRPFIDLLTELLGAFANAPRIVHIAAAAFVVLTGALMGLAGAIMVFRGLGGFGLLFSGIGIMSATFLGFVAVIAGVIAAFAFFSDELGAAKDAVADFFEPVSELIDYLSRINQADNPLDFLIAQGWDGPLLTFAEGLGDVVEGLADLWYFISRGDWDRFMRRLPGELEQMWNGVKLAFSVVPEILGFTSWSDLLMGALAWTGEEIVLPMLTAVVEFGLSLVNKTVGWVGDLWSWIKGQIFGGPAATVNADGSKTVNYLPNEERNIPFGTILVEGAVALGTGFTHIAGRLWEWLQEQLMGGPTYGPPTGTRNGTGSFNTVLSEPIPLGTVILEAAFELAENVWGEAGNFAGWVVSKISEVGDIFIPVEGAKISLVNAVLELDNAQNGEDGGGLFGSIGRTIAEAIPDDLNFIREIGTGFGKAIGKAIAAISPDDMSDRVDWQNFGQNIGAFIRDGMSLIAKAPTALVFGLSEFIWSAISEITVEDLKGIGDIGGGIIAAIGGFLAGLLTGKDSSEWSFGEFQAKLGEKIYGAIGRAIRFGDGSGGKGGFTGLFDDMGNQIVAPDTLSGSIADIVMEEIGNAITRIVEKTGELIPKIWDGLEFAIPMIPFTWNGLVTGVDTAVAFVEEQITRLRNKLKELFGLQDEVGRQGAAGNFFNIQNYDPLNPNNHTNDTNTVTHSPGEGYAIPQGAPFQGSLKPEVSVTLTVDETSMSALTREIESKEFNAELKLDGIDTVMTDFAAAFDMGRAWDSKQFEADAQLNVDAVMISAAAAFDIGRAWDQQNYWGDFSLNVDAVMIAAGAAFDIGRAWDGKVFTASFSVDTSGITAAVEVARQAAADIAAVMPHSPAKEGPLKEPITFDYIGENFGSVADDIRYSADRLTSDVAGLRNRNMAPVDVAPSRTGGMVTKNYYFAVTGDDLARLERQSREGSLDVETTARELEMALGMN